MKYKQLILKKLDLLDNQLRALRSINAHKGSQYTVNSHVRSIEEEANMSEQIKENIEQITTLINQNEEE